jgi:hypothetical protein
LAATSARRVWSGPAQVCAITKFTILAGDLFDGLGVRMVDHGRRQG